MNREINIEELIVRFFEGDITQPEKERLDSWKNENESNKQEYDAFADVVELTGRLKTMHEVDVSKAKAKVKEQIPEFKTKTNILVLLQRIAAILIIPILVLSGYFLFSKNNAEKNIYQEISTSYGIHNKITLPDGTHVWLNSGSALKFPAKFAKNSREVFLRGEAFFNVASNKERPFYVNLGEMSIKAVGTSFNVSAYKEDNIFETTLISGETQLVKKGPDSNEVLIHKMEPNQHAIYNKKEKNISLIEEIPLDKKSISGNNSNNHNVDPENMVNNKYVSWISGKLIFRNDPLDQVSKRLGRWYNVDIELVDSLLYNFNYTATFENETLEQVLDLLCLSAPIQYEIKIRNVSDDQSFTKKQVTLRLIDKN